VLLVRPMAKQRQTFTITDHMCRECGGRVLQIASGGGPSGGGNPLYRCADCGNSSCGIGPKVICWCGFHYRGQTDTPYQCMKFEGNESYHIEMAKCGCLPGKNEIGVIRISR